MQRYVVIGYAASARILRIQEGFPDLLSSVAFRHRMENVYAPFPPVTCWMPQMFDLCNEASLTRSISDCLMRCRSGEVHGAYLTPDRGESRWTCSMQSVLKYVTYAEQHHSHAPSQIDTGGYVHTKTLGSLLQVYRPLAHECAPPVAWLCFQHHPAAAAEIRLRPAAANINSPPRVSCGRHWVGSEIVRHWDSEALR